MKQIVKNNNYNNIDYLFWILLILFSNVGGFQQALKIDELGGGVNLNDFIFFIMTALFITKGKNKLLDRDYILISRYLIIFFIYYVIIFAFLTPYIHGTNQYSNFFILTKLRYTFYSIALFFYVYRFYISSYVIFYRYLAKSSILIIIIFIIAIITGIKILPYEEIPREFISSTRYMLLSYGFMPLLVPIGVILFTFKTKINYRKILLFASILMYLAWTISITRRHIVGGIIYLLLSFFIYSYIKRKKILFIKQSLRLIPMFLLIIVLLYFTFPKYIDAGYQAVDETIYVIEHGQTRTGHIDQRFGFSRIFIVSLFIEHPILGTGFDNRWRTGEGDKQGYEGSDYPFLSALAMTGVSGILVFLPIYILIFKFLKKDLKSLRKIGAHYQYYFPHFVFLLFILFFVYDLLQYFNWFLPVSNSRNFYWYVYLAMYLSSRKIFYSVNNRGVSNE